MTENDIKKSENNKSIFENLNTVDVKVKVKTKNGFDYLPWASAWEEVKKLYPDATHTIYRQIMDDYGNTRFWHDDGKSGWVEVGVTINNLEHRVILPIMNLQNKAISAENITSVEANKSVARCLVKACAFHGLGLYIFQGEDLPEETREINDLVEKIDALVKKKVGLSDSAKSKVQELCKAAEREAHPELDEELILGNYKTINDVETLKQLYNKIMAVRK